MRKCNLSIVIVIIALVGGGLGFMNFLTDSWILILLSNPNAAPTAVSGHSTVLNPVNNTLVIFGGANKTAANNNVALYDLINDGWISKNTSKGAAPTPRYDHSTIVTQTNLMYVFGGRDTKGNVFNDLYKYDMVKDSWSQVTIGAGKLVPAARYGHSGILYSFTNEFVYWGGRNVNGTVLQEIVIFNFLTEEWRILPFSAPNAVSHHSAVLTTANQMVVFGGVTATNTFTADTNFYDLASNTWLNITLNTSSIAVSGRSGHAAIVTPINEMLVFGGRTSNTSASSLTLKYNLLYNTWEIITPTGDGPSARWGITCTSTLFNTMMVFGGQSSDSSYFNDIYKYNIITSVLRSSSDGVVLVVLLTIVCSMIIGLCFALDIMAEKHEDERLERIEKENAGKDGAALKKLKGKQQKERQPLFETF
ncbi:hypothetical protein PPL_05281 [Heterostelium album PN500]|uniref:Galactose oxidase n=1 Tax=Heterostelium pallidum (strain ATCC 26659 / Pp 5 / PN500) TaxID=670386 RepID=D3BB95_HETP5|nr:hypothetical protein PPL_05281 [Heterostelium album PN500]EFA81302.1 hypothetical protein PPL_05281 [Heterostelium album PN500]|eukprot:XP_020433420.1 hypothetical protein PPL_05281 [Heterostelium album PN500]